MLQILKILHLTSRSDIHLWKYIVFILNYFSNMKLMLLKNRFLVHKDLTYFRKHSSHWL